MDGNKDKAMKCVANAKDANSSGKKEAEGLNEGPSNTEEHVQVVHKIKRSMDHYEILGVGKSCSVEEVKKAYKKLALKVHPDKNKAPGSEEAFKKVSVAFKCLSDDNLRRQYDQTDLVKGDGNSQHYNAKKRRTGHNMFDDAFDFDKIFKPFFYQGDVFHRFRVFNK
ncbi:putative DnaJ domain, Chaperone J-domain superfamily [Helianthus debilis subsp. tardiflorus]